MIMHATCIEYFLYNYYYLLCFYITYLLYTLHILYILALVESSQALLPTTCHPKAVGGVCYGTITNCIIDTW